MSTWLRTWSVSLPHRQTMCWMKRSVGCGLWEVIYTSVHCYTKSPTTHVAFLSPEDTPGYLEAIERKGLIDLPKGIPFRGTCLSYSLLLRARTVPCVAYPSFHSLRSVTRNLVAFLHWARNGTSGRAACMTIFYQVKLLTLKLWLCPQYLEIGFPAGERLLNPAIKQYTLIALY